MELEHPRLRSDLGPLDDVPFHGEVNGLIKFRLSHEDPQPTAAEKRPLSLLKKHFGSRKHRAHTIQGVPHPPPNLEINLDLDAMDS